MKTIYKNKKYIKKYLISFLFIIIGISSIITITYKGLFYLKLKKYTRKNNIKTKLMIKHDNGWYKKQTKYLSGKILKPISFLSKNENNQSIIRNGLLLIDKKAPATVLVCHGFMSSKEDMGLMRTILDGYNVMTFDFRAHGENCLNQNCTFGREEKHDVIAAAEFIKKHPDLKNKPLFVYGFSMGAASSILAQHERPDLFAGAIWDCPFESIDGLINRALERMKVYLFGYTFILPGSFFLKKYVYHPYIQEIVKFFFKTFSRMDATQVSTIVKPISPHEAINNINIPFLLIGCHNDDKAPPIELLKIFKNAKSSQFKRLWIASGRRHFDAFFVNPEKYIYKIQSFLKLLLNKNFKNKKQQKIKEDPCIYCFL
jgi:pimeloyl-ACP methyl ester carboxylesterase